MGQPPVNPPAQPIPQHQAPPVAQPQYPPVDNDEVYVDDEVDPDVLREMTTQMDEAINMQENQRADIRAPPLAGLASTSKGKHTACANSKPTLHLNTTVASSSPKAPSTVSSLAKTSVYFTTHSSDSKPILDIGLSPRPAPLPSPEPDFDITWDVDCKGTSSLPAKKHDSTSARLPLPAQKKQVVPSERRFSSPDPYDDLSFDMDVDESFFEQVGMIEQDALGTAVKDKGKGKGKDAVAEGMTLHSRPSTAGKKAPSGSALGTKSLAMFPVSPSGTERSTRMRSTKRATSTSSLSGSTETPMPQSTQSSGRRLPRDPSLIVISSSDDEALAGGHSAARPPDPVRRRVQKRKEMDEDHAADSDVISISD